MVGIVLVSHSKKLAQGAKELIEQVVREKIKIEEAAGTSDGRLGTDAFLIEEKIIEVFDGDGVLVIPDLGSAVMSAEMAIEDLREDVRKKVCMADAPFVEGAMSAAMEASFGKSLEEVKKAAEDTRGMKKIM
ncbi:dihydroxyacetone kinase phosphoryl donor subunit DhaM [Tepidanaerobacter syntrophicus]|uniref:phosphoenolpyruvate--glycerone phosphotransferase n=1 Tax=Tepidanaerobacter syntrophicus TaxID=224999 RepID=A0A0U9HLG8_9FIRM|nr:dihydroxyacetone kinase phosphoryl donor subunit DhaM [Tepidanaerobacter syntrophicus]GAQ25171.1 dihydroxyacetone kinase, phosphotransfer subunit [Tepidanaerobacter syntrophicus]GLI18660.1 PTS mannose transporter subunit IID [Tepidanaerobacter syntrophicus]